MAKKMIWLEDALDVLDQFTGYIPVEDAARIKLRLRVLPCVAISEPETPDGDREIVVHGADGKPRGRLIMKGGAKRGGHG